MKTLYAVPRGGVVHKLYVVNRFSLHMLNDVVLLKGDGALRITPISESQAKALVQSFDEQGVFYLDYNTLFDLTGEEPLTDNEVKNVRIVRGDSLLVVLRYGTDRKIYAVEYGHQ